MADVISQIKCQELEFCILVPLNSTKLHCNTKAVVDTLIDEKPHELVAVVVPDGAMATDVILGQDFVSKVK